MSTDREITHMSTDTETTCQQIERKLMSTDREITHVNRQRDNSCQQTER